MVWGRADRGDSTAPSTCTLTSRYPAPFKVVGLATFCQRLAWFSICHFGQDLGEHYVCPSLISGDIANNQVSWFQERLAKFMGRQESIIYSYDLSTIPSVLPAFANAKDLIVMDEVNPILNPTPNTKAIITKTVCREVVELNIRAVKHFL